MNKREERLREIAGAEFENAMGQFWDIVSNSVYENYDKDEITEEETDLIYEYVAEKIDKY